MAAAYAPPTTMSALKEYVTGAAGGMQAPAESTVTVFVTHNHLKARFPEIRLDKHVSCAALLHGDVVAAAVGYMNSMWATTCAPPSCR